MQYSSYARGGLQEAMNPVYISKAIELLNRGYGSGDVKRYLSLNFGITDDEWRDIKKVLKGSGIKLKKDGIGTYIRRLQYFKRYRKENREYFRAYYLAHRDKYLEWSRQYYRKHRDYIIKRNSESYKRWRILNKEHIIRYKRVWRESNREYINAYMRSYYEKNKEKMRAYYREYYRKNKDRISARRAQKLQEKEEG